MAVPAPRGRAALPARQRRHVASPGHLNQHRQVRAQRLARRLERDGGQPGTRSSIAFERDVAVAGRVDPGRALAHDRPRRDEIVCPPGLDERLRLGGAREPARDERRPRLVHPQQRHLPRVRVGGAGFGVGVVAVVPDRDQPEIGDRREHGAAGADDHPRGAAQHREPAPVPRGRAEPRRKPDRRVPDQIRTRGQHPVEIALVRDDEQRPRSPRRGDRREFGKPPSPVLPRQCLPRRPRCAALGERGHERIAVPVGRPPNLRDRHGHPLAGWLLLHPRVPRRDRQAQDVAAGTGVAGRDRRRHGQDLGRQNPLG